MEQKKEGLVHHLCIENNRFRMLYREHELLEKELQQFGKKSFLTTDEDLERKKLQKLKLAGKDEMERILQQHRA